VRCGSVGSLAKVVWRMTGRRGGARMRYASCCWDIGCGWNIFDGRFGSIGAGAEFLLLSELARAVLAGLHSTADFVVGFFRFVCRVGCYRLAAFCSASVRRLQGHAFLGLQGPGCCFCLYNFISSNRKK
jgi:hypothetical protein